MTKVYVVTSGEYSDYRIRGIFTTEEAANRYKESVGSDANDIGEWELDTPNLKIGYVYYCVDMYLETGEAFNVCRVDPDDEDRVRKHYEPLPGERMYELVARRNELPANVYRAFVWARSDEHAIKVANERRTYYLATGQIANPSQTHLRQPAENPQSDGGTLPQS